MKKLISVLLAAAILLSCSVLAVAAEYTEIPINNKYRTVGSDFFGGLIEVSNKSNTMSYALMDKNGKIITDFNISTGSRFPDGSYTCVVDETDKTSGIVLNRHIVFGKNGKELRSIQTIKDGQDLYPPYYMALNNYFDDYHTNSEIFDVAVAGFHDYEFNGGDYHIFAADGTPLYVGKPAASIMIDRGIWIELLAYDEKRIGWVNKNTGEFTTETPENPYIYCGGYGAVKNGSKYEVYNNAGELQFTYDGSKYECTVADLQFDKNGFCVVYDKPLYGSDKYGMIDTKGNLVLPLEYGWLSDTEDGVIRAIGPHKLYKDPAYGLIDINGNVIADFEYAYITPFENGIAAFRAYFSRNEGGYIDTKGNVIVDDCQYITDDNMLGKWGVYVANGDYIEVQQSEDSVAAYQAKALYDRNGNRLTTKPYEYIGQFNEGLAPVLYNRDPRISDPNNLYRLGYIDVTGKEVIPCEWRYTSYDRLQPYYYGGLPLFKDGATVLYKNSSQYIVYNPLMSHGVTAPKNASTVMVNGKKVAVDAYTVDGYNYFKLRDVATMLNGTEKQFNVGWNSAKGAIDIQTGKGYAAEIVSDGKSSNNAKLNYPIVYQNGVILNEFSYGGIQTYGLTAYTIDGNNYFQLRDLGKLLDFNVSYDAVNNCISIDTTKPY